MTVKLTLICDIETYHGFFLIAFKRTSDGRVRTFELSDRPGRSPFDGEVVRRIMLQNRIVTYNGLGYDVPLIFSAINGATNAELKLGSDRIIMGNVRYWDVEKLLGISVPRLDHIDLMEPQPNAFASLKTLNGRLHGKKMQDLPFDPAATLSHADMAELVSYCGNDLDATHLLFDGMKEPLDMRDAIGAEYGMDFRSKSDAQMGEGIIKKRVQDLTGERPQRVETPAGSSFKYPIPHYLNFQCHDLREVLERLRTTDFFVKGDGKVDMPGWLEKKHVTIGETTYAMGIGGLHSTEKNRAVHSDADSELIDFDVASYYPAIILGSGLYPKALGRTFLDVFAKIRAERLAAKERAKEIEALEKLGPISDELKAEKSRAKAKEAGLKIALNGCFGKLGSRYSILYAPHLMIAVTLTGQLALLMLIERAETAGIPVVSGNTDGVVFRCPLGRRNELEAITKQWEAETGFELESTQYRSLYSLSVNTYIAIKADGKAKRKGVVANPRAEGDLRTQLMINPSMNVCSDAVVKLITHGTPVEETIRACTDIRDFVTVVNVKGGGTWRDEYLGKVVRYIWSRHGDPIFYKTPHASTGNFKKVSKTDGCRPVMELPDELPIDIDYQRYIDECSEILMNIGYTERPPEVKRTRVYKKDAMHWLALSIAA